MYCAREGPEDAFGGAAFVDESREGLEYAAKTLPGATGIVNMDLDEANVPGGGLRVTVTDPIDGFPFHLPTEKNRPRNSTQRFKSGPAPVHKLGHFGMYMTDFARAYEFYTTRFNFKPSNLIHDPYGKDVTAFLHLDRGRELVDHHCFFLSEGPKWHVHHSLFEPHDFDTQLLGHHWLREKGYRNCWGSIIEHCVDETYSIHRSLASPDNLHIWAKSNYVPARA
ncbi:hypothetical protein BJX64DRAFT_282254 [Aspergillus heterothallicus]